MDSRGNVIRFQDFCKGRLINALVLASIVLGLSMFMGGTTSQAEGDESKSLLQWPPISSSPEERTNELLGYRWGIVDDFAIANSFISTAPYKQGYCDSFADAECIRYVRSEGENWWSYAVFPPCSMNIPTNCIEGVFALTEKGEKRAMELDRVLNYPKPQNDKFLPEVSFSSASLWKLPGESTDMGYMVSVGSDVVLEDSKNEESRKSLSPFSASIVPYRVLDMPSSNDPLLSRDANGIRRFGFGYPPGCIWGEKGVCGARRTFSSDLKMSLVLRVGYNTSSWFFGRISEPGVVMEAINANQVRISIVGKPVLVPLFETTIPIDVARKEFTKEQLSEFCNPIDSPICAKGFVGGYSASWSDSSSRMFALTEKLLGENAKLMMPSWSIRAFPPGDPFPGCPSRGLVKGVVTTNASIYQGGPPSFSKGELTYQVAALHRTDQGHVFEGTYHLLVDSQAARCFYKITGSDLEATISIISQEGNSQVATTSFRENEDWLYFSASGFTFSRPNISVKLFEKKHGSSIESSETNSVTLPSDLTKSYDQVDIKKKKSLLCQSKKSKKTLRTSKNKCPRGFTVLEINSKKSIAL